jgi:hypothetical protein
MKLDLRILNEENITGFDFPESMKRDIDEEFKKTPLQNYPVVLHVSHAMFDKLKEKTNE